MPCRAADVLLAMNADEKILLARSTSQAAGGGMRGEIKNWHAVASWTWTSEDDVCGICHMALDGCAPGAIGPGDDSPVVWGRVRRRHRARPTTRPARPEHVGKRVPQCSHYFHLMCINTWLHNKNTCPICRRKWEFASAPKPAPATPGARPSAPPT